MSDLIDRLYALGAAGVPEATEAADALATQRAEIERLTAQQDEWAAGFLKIRKALGLGLHSHDDLVEVAAAHTATIERLTAERDALRAALNRMELPPLPEPMRNYPEKGHRLLGVVNGEEQTMLTSFVCGHEGDCKPVWLNRNQLCNRLDGGVTGFFRRVERLTWWPYFAVKVGPEFHGIIRGGAVRTVMPGSDA